MDLLYTTHVPEGPGPHPTLIALHGWGASAHDLLGLAPVLHGGKAMVLCPQGSLAFQAGPGMLGYGWFPLSQSGPPDVQEIEKSLVILNAWIDEALARFPADPKKLVLGGFSQGGFMAYLLALRAPERYKALLALSSWLPEELAKSIAKQPAHAELPALVIHGTEDPMIAVERAHASRDALLALGVPTRYREYAMGHEIRQEALQELVGWLEEMAWGR
jgi:phospholipase/carboxylesterase